ncbi:patatin-like phospholipase family protein [Syntrophomonas palmitatica]|uniref:patatin-like phospholipase family protein n=1 Tax=Syntrophomonas palmitatica TaxID=402877 RepID=UPI0006D0925C|nr:patatin-like phospholipase family protein [Syntrophomonas palmitatica]
MPGDRNKVGLALGAGSARGLAHIGVIQVLIENDIPIDYIAGSSMGAMVGGIYACGSDIYMLGKMAAALDSRVFMDIQVPRFGFVAGKRIKGLLELLTKKKTFSEADPSLAIVASDLMSGQRVTLKEGSIAEAIRASISVPGVFRPVRQGEMVLVDGAVTERLPVQTARAMGADVVIAVDVSCGEGKTVSINNTMDVIMAALDIMIKQQFDLTNDKGDILIQPDVSRYAPRDFAKTKEIIELGRQAAEANIKAIKRLTT